MISTRRLFSISAFAFLLRLCGAGIMLGLQVLIAQKLGSAQLGLYTVILSICNIVAVILPMGFQTIASYFAAAYANEQRGHALRQFAIQAFTQTVVMAVLGLLFGAQILALTFNDQFRVAENWPVIVIAALGLALMQLSASVLISLKAALTGLSGDTIIRPVISAIALGVAFYFFDPPFVIEKMFFYLAIGFMIVATVYVATMAYRIWQTPKQHELLSAERKQWWFYAAPWTILALASDFFFDLDLLLLTPYLDLHSLAIFGIASRLVSLASYGVNAIYAVVLPDLFKTAPSSSDHLFISQIQNANRNAVAMSLLMLTGAIFVAPHILKFLGEEFAIAATPFAILCLCPLVRVVFGPTALVLSIHQKPYSSLPPVVVGFATLIICNNFLVPSYHVTGAAISAVIATTVWSFSLWLLAVRKTGIDVSIFSGFFARQKMS